jgi:peptidyl-prolyl cis-trans isomerase C
MRHSDGNLRWLILSGLIVLLLTFSALAADPVITKQKAASINGVIISMNDLNNEYRQFLKQKGATENDIPADKALEVKKGLLDNLINQELLFQESKKKNIVVEEAAVAGSIAKVKETFENEDAYQKALKDANIKGNDLEARLRRSLAINALVDEQIGRDLVVTDEESKQYYDTHPDAFVEAEQVRASHILIKADKAAGESKKVAAKEKIKTLQRKIKEGEDFAKLARENSEDPSSSANGGDLGYFKKGAMVKEFEDAAFALTPGAVSDIVETQFGYHLIKAADKKEAGTISYDTVKNNLQNFLKQQKRSKEVSLLLETLRKGAKIETFL